MILRQAWALALLLPFAQASTPLPQKPQASRSQFGDAEAEALAREAMASKQESFRREAMKRLSDHRFKTSKAPEKEYCLFAQGMLEAQYVDTLTGASTLKKLEKGWPKSPYLEEAQVVLATEAMEHKRIKEAETRLRRALASDLPSLQKRRAQETLMWFLVEQNRPEEGLDVVQTLHPLGSEAPTEKGLAAVAIILCGTSNRSQADQAVKSYLKLFPKGSLVPKVHLAWGRHLGAQGDTRGSATVLRKIIREHPQAPELDEARLALATLLSEGKLPDKYRKAYPEPSELLRDMNNVDPTSDLGRRQTLVKLRLALREGQWKAALDHSETLRKAKPTTEELGIVDQLQADAFRAFVRETLDKGPMGGLLPYLTPDNLVFISSEVRKVLVAKLALAGLPQAARTVRDLAPPAEQEPLRKALVEATSTEAHPETVLELVPERKASPGELLRRAQAAVVKGDWTSVSNLLPRAKPGADRIQVALALLRRPPTKGENRRREAEGLLQRAPERGGDREPLAILVADLRAQEGAWREALSLYPEKPRPEARGWVALMRATAFLKTGRPDQAKAVLNAHKDEPAFRMERETLARKLD